MREVHGFNMSVRTIESGDVAVLEFAGRLTLGAPAYVFSEALHELLASHRSVILNLKSVTAIDCAGVGALCGCIATARTAGKKLRYITPSPRVQEMLGLTNVSGLLAACESVEQALIDCAA